MNRKINNIFILFAVVILLFLSSCSKQQEPSTTEMTKNSETTAPMENASAPDATPESTTPAMTDNANDAASDQKSAAAADAGEQPDNSTESMATEVKSEASGQHEEQLALARKSGCLACHAIDRKVVGPAWKDVAQRYKDDPNAKSRLIAKVSKGGSGNWKEVVGSAAMPPYSPRVSDENIGKLVEFVLSLQ